MNKRRVPLKGKAKTAANLAQNIPRGGTPIKKSIPEKTESKEREEEEAANNEQR